MFADISSRHASNLIRCGGFFLDVYRKRAESLNLNIHAERFSSWLFFRSANEGAHGEGEAHRRALVLSQRTGMKIQFHSRLDERESQECASSSECLLFMITL